MPEWTSSNGRARLVIHAERLTGRFEKATGECSYQGTNAIVAYEDRNSGVRRTFIAEQVTLSEDERYVYFQPAGRIVEETERISAAARASSRRRRREETRVSNR